MSTELSLEWLKDATDGLGRVLTYIVGVGLLAFALDALNRPGVGWGDLPGFLLIWTGVWLALVVVAFPFHAPDVIAAEGNGRAFDLFTDFVGVIYKYPDEERADEPERIWCDHW